MGTGVLQRRQEPTRGEERAASPDAAVRLRDGGGVRWPRPRGKQGWSDGGGGHESSFAPALAVPRLGPGLEHELVGEAWAPREGQEVAFGLTAGQVGRRRKTKPSPKVPNGADKLCAQS